MCFVFSIYSIYFFFFSVPFIGFPGFPSHPKTQFKKNNKNPKSKLQNPDQKASKPTRVCPTRVSAHPSAQQLRPQKLKHLNPLLPFILMNKLGCLPHIFFPVIKAAVFYMEFWFMTGLPQEVGQSVFCKFISTESEMSSWQSPKKVCKVRLINISFVSQKTGTNSKNVLGKVRESFVCR